LTALKVGYQARDVEDEKLGKEQEFQGGAGWSCAAAWLAAITSSSLYGKYRAEEGSFLWEKI